MKTTKNNPATYKKRQVCAPTRQAKNDFEKEAALTNFLSAPLLMGAYVDLSPQKKPSKR